MTMPNFFIIGAQKAGTTSLYHYLDQHPQIYMSPVKEPFFFNYEITPQGEAVSRRNGGRGRRIVPRFANIEEYRALFRGVGGETAIGEATTSYIYRPGIARRIKRWVPEARTIALLRDPADRAYSAFLHAVRGGREPVNDFARVLREEEGRMRNDWSYVNLYRDVGFYYEQLKRYYEAFGRERVGVWLYEDLRDDPAGVTQGVFRFLGVDDAFLPKTFSQYNPAGAPRSETVRVMMRFINTRLPMIKGMIPAGSRGRQAAQKWMFAEPQPIDPEIRGELIEGYREDILKLEELIGRDLSGWLR